MQGALFNKDDSQSWVSQSAFAKNIGVSAQAVRKAIDSNRFDQDALRSEKAKSGKTKYRINIIEGAKQWEENRGGSVSTPLADKTHNDAKKREQTANANIAELKFQELDGQLIRAADVKEHFSRIAATIRDAFLNEPVKLAPVISNVDDVNEIEQILKEKFTEILKELSDAGLGGTLFR
ncbi:MAG: hypothetical protein JKY93_01080 [Gammaproteobacteria bacterium]|nr:hypothetical protein [Gammaproteobacteria bacterium]